MRFPEERVRFKFDNVRILMEDRWCLRLRDQERASHETDGPGQTHATLDQPPKLDHVRSQHGALVPLDDARVVLDEEQAVGVDHDVELVLAREAECDPRRELHVLRTAEARGRGRSVGWHSAFDSASGRADHGASGEKEKGVSV